MFSTHPASQQMSYFLIRSLENNFLIPTSIFTSRITKLSPNCLESDLRWGPKTHPKSIKSSFGPPRCLKRCPRGLLDAHAGHPGPQKGPFGSKNDTPEYWKINPTRIPNTFQTETVLGDPSHQKPFWKRFLRTPPTKNPFWWPLPPQTLLEMVFEDSSHQKPSTWYLILVPGTSCQVISNITNLFPKAFASELRTSIWKSFFLAGSQTTGKPASRSLLPRGPAAGAKP